MALLLSVLFLAIIAGGCSVYFNTFYNAKKYFNQAEKAYKRGGERPGIGRADYQKAIEKALKVIEQHPNSRYYDDALFILAVSYYKTEQYGRAERRFREIMANYAETEWARQSTLYLAQSKLGLSETDEAMTLFQQIFNEKYDRKFKTKAAVALGEYYFNEKEYEKSEKYFLAVRDSLGDDAARLKAQMYIADGLYAGFRFKDALGGYLQVLGMDPDKYQRYHALYRAALCSYQLLRISDGLDYLQKLIDDELYFDSLGVLKLTVAQGQELDDDLLQAEVTYEDVANTSVRPAWKATALYRLGLIYQLDYGNLERAKELYDQSLEANRGGEIAQDALQRSSDIAKLRTYAWTELDSTATKDDIDEAAYTQLSLSELNWYQLDNPDTAIIQMQVVVDSFPTSYWAPKAMVAVAEMTRDELENDKVADSILKAALKRYPNSDFKPEILSALGLTGTSADTGYAQLYIDKAEDFLVDKEMPDSALAYYQYVVDNFPESKFYLPARFASVWVRENNFAVGDSSIIYAYQAIADSFPGTQQAHDASLILKNAPRETIKTDTAEVEDTLFAEENAPDTAQQPLIIGTDTIQPGEYVDPRIALYYRPDGDSLINMKLEPIQVLREFEFPEQAATIQQYEWTLYYQVQVDFSGKVIDYVLKIPTGVVDIDERANETIESMTFDGIEVANRISSAGRSPSSDGRGYWFVYEYHVVKPEYLR